MSRNEPIQNRRVNVRGVIMHDGKLFCQKLKNSHSLHDNEFWSTPGGGIDFGESLHEALVREMIEETGVAPKIGNLLFVQQFMDGDREQLEFFFHITNARDYLDINLAKTTHGELEVETYGFVDPKATVILPSFLTDVDLGASIQESGTTFITYEGR